MKTERFLAAAISIAIASIFFACSSDGGGGSSDPGSSSSEVPSSSSGGSSSSALSSSSVSSSSSSFSSACQQNGVVSGSPVSYGGKTYETVVICGQTWMARNLDYDPGPSTGNSWCYVGKDSYDDTAIASCDRYGRLYDWTTAMGISAAYSNTLFNGNDVKRRGICPSGWHIPSEAEWDALVSAIEAIQGIGTAGKHLKAVNGWRNRTGGTSGNGLDTYGFTALPGGNRHPGGNFQSAGSYSGWWSSTEDYGNSSWAYHWSMSYDYDYVSSINNGKSFVRSVRCVQD
jgi:uncharacterized protein (TIGR02145 family)